MHCLSDLLNTFSYTYMYDCIVLWLRCRIMPFGQKLETDFSVHFALCGSWEYGSAHLTWLWHFRNLAWKVEFEITPQLSVVVIVFWLFIFSFTSIRFSVRTVVFDSLSGTMQYEMIYFWFCRKKRII